MPKKKAMLFGARPFKVMKCASKSTNRRGATSCATKGRRVSRALHDAGSGTGEAESCGKALELSNTTMSSDQLQGKKPNTNVKETMARIYNDIEKESVAVSNDHLNKVEKWAPVLASECMAKFSVIEAATAYLRDDADPLSADVLEVVASEFVGLNSQMKSAQLSLISKTMCIRYGELLKAVHWTCLSILAHSTTFRDAAETFDTKSWDVLAQCIDDNCVSLRVFGKSRGVDYKTSPAGTSKYIPLQCDLETLTLLESDQEVRAGDKHAFVIDEEILVLNRTRYRGQLQIDIPTNIYNEKDFDVGYRPWFWPKEKPYPQDPTLRSPMEGICACCSSRDICDCDPRTHPSITRPLVEIYDYKAKGKGVRALQSIRKGDLLIEYVGEIRSHDYIDDPIYGFSLTLMDPNCRHRIGTLSPKIHGNWTRFMNHSCKPGTRFVQHVIGNRIRVMVVAVKDIAWGEEVTVHYGWAYWSMGKMCLCGEDNCVSVWRIEVEEALVSDDENEDEDRDWSTEEGGGEDASSNGSEESEADADHQADGDKGDSKGADSKVASSEDETSKAKSAFEARWATTIFRF